jgi:hypothetical protein
MRLNKHTEEGVACLRETDAEQTALSLLAHLEELLWEKVTGCKSNIFICQLMCSRYLSAVTELWHDPGGRAV